ncbi:MAG: lipoate--protein ligase [Clostridiales bacterium]|jgi:lipoate-protein ligase A|nr:lipoate--protein ligase [Clostridiales bacterium]
MKLKFYQTDLLNPYRNLAIEKYFTDGVADGEYIIYFWGNKDTVVIGRNQYAYDQFDAAETARDGIKIARRLSGGGAVYHDENNLNFSFVMNTNEFDKNSGYEIILNALRSMGVNAERSGRNDMTADGRKFSGNAFLSRGKAYCHHGTILINTDTERMARYLHVPEEKLANKGVRSVKSRVVNLAEIDHEISREGIMRSVWVAAERFFGEPAEVIGDDYFDAKKLAEGERFFSDKRYIFGERLDGYARRSARTGYGHIDLYVRSDASGKVLSARIFTDSMLLPNIERAEKLLTGDSADRATPERAVELLSGEYV